MELTIRPADIQDTLLLSEISVKTFYDTYAPFNTENDMKLYTSSHFNEKAIELEVSSGTKQYFMAFLDRSIAGYASLKTWNNDGKIAEIARIYVLNEFKKRNIGKRLIEHLVAIAKQLGYKSMQLGVWQQNEPAIEFYKKLGFAITGKQAFLLGEDLQSDWIMSRNLQV